MQEPRSTMGEVAKPSLKSYSTRINKEPLLGTGMNTLAYFTLQATEGDGEGNL